MDWFYGRGVRWLSGCLSYLRKLARLLLLVGANKSAACGSGGCVRVKSTFSIEAEAATPPALQMFQFVAPANSWLGPTHSDLGPFFDVCHRPPLVRFK